jgi:hypothetical protein
MTLRVSGQLTREDFGRLAAVLYGNAVGRWRVVLGLAAPVAGAIGAGFGLALAEATALEGVGRTVLAGGLAFLFVVGATALAQSFAYRRQLAEEGAFLRPFQLEADVEGLTVRSETAATRLMWDAVLDISVTAHFVVIYTDAAAALALPARAFRDEATMKAFAERVRLLWQKSTGTETV